MSDLVERLREVQGNVTKSYRNPEGPEAADEIERLRDAYNATVTTNETVERLTAELQIANDFAARTVTRTDILKREAENAQLQAEIERLTADLNESERQTRAQLSRVMKRDAEIERLREVIEEQNDTIKDLDQALAALEDNNGL